MKKEGSPVLPFVMVFEEKTTFLRLLSLTVPLPECSARARPDMTGLTRAAIRPGVRVLSR